MIDSNLAIEVTDLNNTLNGNSIHADLSFHVLTGEICAIVGGSGSGKTTLIYSILRLITPQKGKIQVLGTDLINCSNKELNIMRQRWGVLFQKGALISSLSVLDNICFPLKEFTQLSTKSLYEFGLLRLLQVGLDASTAWKYPSELSGGMLKRVALARAIVLDPELIFLDEPTAGLDPKSSDSLEDLILHLHQSLNLTIVIITHDLDTLWRLPHRVAFLGDKRVIATQPMKDLVKNEHPLIKNYFSGQRSRIRYNLKSDK